MIDWKSILSLYNGKATLLQWLKKVEKAVGDSVLTGVKVDKTTPTAATLTLTFADGSEETSPEFLLPSAGQPEDIDGINLNVGQNSVLYDLTDGMQVENTALIKYRTYDKNANVKFAIPIKAGDGISIDKAVGEEWFIIKNTGITTINGEHGAVNLKTLFGQSVVGNGNISVYKHDIQIEVLVNTNGSVTATYARIIPYSSNNLIVNSLDKLKTLLGQTFYEPCSYLPYSEFRHGSESILNHNDSAVSLLCVSERGIYTAAGTESSNPQIRYFTKQGSHEFWVEVNINDDVTEI